MKRFLIAILLVLAVPAAAQTDMSIHVNQFPGSTVAAKVSNAMASCSAVAPTQCYLIIDASLAPMTTGTLPTMCSNCQLVDFRSTWAGQSVIAASTFNELVSGCGVQWTGNLNFTIGACSYSIAGLSYNAPLTNLTLASDPSNPRIDVIYADNTGAIGFLAGTPAASPQAPTIDPATQIGITFVTIAANGTQPSNTSSLTIFDEGSGGEWTASYGSNFGLSTIDPYHLTHDIAATNAYNVAGVTLNSGSPVNLQQYNSLVFYIRSTGQWPTGKNRPFLYISWTDGSGNQLGSQVYLFDGLFGFSSANTSSYQQISIPISSFGSNLTSVSNLSFGVHGGSAGNSIGSYLDYVTLQGGSGAISLPTTLMNFKGTWNASAAYSPNDCVVLNGVGYVALQASTNQPVTNGTYWTPLSSSGPASIPVVVDTASPVTVSGSNNVEYHYNESSTSTAPVTYDLPAASAGKQFCFTNANNGSQADTGVLALQTSGSGQYVILDDGTLSLSGGEVASAGAAADSACLTGVDATHWMLRAQQGSWISPTSGPFVYVTSVTQPGSGGLVNFSFTAASGMLYIAACTNSESSNGPTITISSPTPTGQNEVLDNEVVLRWLYYSSGGSVTGYCNGGAVGTNKVSIFSCPACIAQAPLTTGHTSSSGTITSLTVSGLTTSARSYTLACEGDTSANEPLTSATIDSISGTLFPAQIQNANCAWAQATTSYASASAVVNWTTGVSQAGEVVFAFQY